MIVSSIVGETLARLLNLWVIVLFVRIVLSWFPISPGSAMASVFSVLYALTEPVLGPVRRLVPSMGMIDISPIIVLLVIEFIVAPNIARL